MSFFINSIIESVIVKNVEYNVNNSIAFTIKKLINSNKITIDDLKNIKYTYKCIKRITTMTYNEKLEIANTILADKGLAWDDLSDINSLHDAENEEDIKELVNERLEEDGFMEDEDINLDDIEDDDIELEDIEDLEGFDNTEEDDYL